MPQINISANLQVFQITLEFENDYSINCHSVTQTLLTLNFNSRKKLTLQVNIYIFPSNSKHIIITI